MSSFNRKQLTQYRHDIGRLPGSTTLAEPDGPRRTMELASQICPRSFDADEVLAAVGLADRVRNFPGQLSGGEQRAWPSPAPWRRTPSSFVRRPTGALDHETGKAILKLLQDTCRDTGARSSSSPTTARSPPSPIGSSTCAVGSPAAVELNEAPLSADVLVVA